MSAYEEWGENAPQLAGNLRLDKLDSPQAIGRALAETHRRVGGFDAATRGRITQAETERLAGELGMTADDLLARRKGQAIPQRGGVGPDIVSPIYTSTNRRDATTSALPSAGIGLTMPPRKVGDRELSPAEYGRYAERSGAIFKPRLDALVRSPEWRAGDDDSREDAVRKIVRAGRKEARAELFGAARPRGMFGGRTPPAAWAPPIGDAVVR